MEGETSRTERWLATVTAPSRPVAVATIAIALAVAWLIAVRSGNAVATSRHLFYVPVVLAAFRFRVPGAVVTGIAAGLLAGPLVPVEGSGDLATWSVRAAFLLAIGLLVAVLVEAQRRATREKLRLAERAARHQQDRLVFLQTISHEFRTPLTTILGAAELMDARADLPASSRRRLEGALLRAARRMHRMVVLILEAAGASDSSQVVAKPVGAVVQGAIAMLDATGDRVRIGREGWEWPVSVREEGASTVVYALVDNALKFSEGPVAVSFERTDGYVRVSVRDAGPGFPPAFLDQAGEPFTQADPSATRERGGLGIGLYVARQLTRRHGGHLELGNHPEGGAVSSWYVPAAGDRPHAPRPATGPTTGQEPGTRSPNSP